MPASLYIGIDLGTTFTGVAYARPPSKTIHIIRRWPGSHAFELKVPTRLFYNRGELLGWGFADPRNRRTFKERDWDTLCVVERFKLGIDPKLDVDPGITSTQHNRLLDTPRWYKDYLRCLYEHVEDFFQELFPWEWSKEVEFTFSVPNLYGPHIIAKFREYILDAGFCGGLHHVSIVSLTESQAAIVYASHSLALFKNNDLVLVCDAGGGTTDCSLLRIVHEDGGRLQMEEVNLPFGMQIGSTDINNAIKDLYFSWLRLQPEVNHESQFDNLLDREIEDYKVLVTTDTSSPLVLHIKGCPELQISSAKVKSIFYTCVIDILHGINKEMELVSSTDMLEADSMYVVLCGGLGSSQFVRATMIELLPDSAISHASVIDIQDPQLVVAKGLVAERLWATADTREMWMEDSGLSSDGITVPTRLADPHSSEDTQSTMETIVQSGWKEHYQGLSRVEEDRNESTSEISGGHMAYRPPLPPPPSTVSFSSGARRQAKTAGSYKKHGGLFQNRASPGTMPSSTIDRPEANLSPISINEPGTIVVASTGIPSDRTTLGSQIVRGGERAASSRSSETENWRLEFRSDYGELNGRGDSVTRFQLAKLQNLLIDSSHPTILYSERITRWVENGVPPHGSGKVDVGENAKPEDESGRGFEEDQTYGPPDTQEMKPATLTVVPRPRLRLTTPDILFFQPPHPPTMNSGTLNSEPRPFEPSPVNPDILTFGPPQPFKFHLDAFHMGEPQPDAISSPPINTMHGEDAYYAPTASEATTSAKYGVASVEAVAWSDGGDLPQKSHKRWTSLLRSHKGCTTCREDRIKCDQKRPQCASCKRRHRLRDYPPGRPTMVTVVDDLAPGDSGSMVCKSEPAGNTPTQAPSKSIFSKRRCRVSYGVLKLELYDESKHLRQDVWRFPLNNKLYVENIIEWVIKQGEEIDDKWTALFMCQKLLSHSEGDREKFIFQTHLVTSTKKAHQLPKSMTQGGAETLCDIEADLSGFPLSEFEKHVHKLGAFKRSRNFYLVKYHVAASSSPADILFEVFFRGKSTERRVQRRVLWHDLPQNGPPTLTPDIGSLSLKAV